LALKPSNYDYLAAGEDNQLTMIDFLKSIEKAQTNLEGQTDVERVKDVGISSAALKKQLKKLTKGMFLFVVFQI
jgi:hypothetical protein